MSVYIESIGNQKISYPDHKNIEFYSLSEYITLAKKSISTFANRFYHGLAAKMLRDEDAVSNIAYAIMLADWRYDENHTGKNKQTKTRYSYRNQCALWAIKTHISKNRKTKKASMLPYSLDYVSSHNDNDNDAYAYVTDTKSLPPIEDLIHNEEVENHCLLIDNLLENPNLSTKQKEYIQLYFLEGYTYDQIGKKFSLTRESVRQSIIKAIQTIKKEYGVASNV